MICPVTDKICNDPDCKLDGWCLEIADEEGEEIKGKDAVKTPD